MSFLCTMETVTNPIIAPRRHRVKVLTFAAALLFAAIFVVALIAGNMFAVMWLFLAVATLALWGGSAVDEPRMED